MKGHGSGSSGINYQEIKMNRDEDTEKKLRFYERIDLWLTIFFIGGGVTIILLMLNQVKKIFGP